jgi:hypothetical protein
MCYFGIVSIRVLFDSSSQVAKDIFQLLVLVSSKLVALERANLVFLLLKSLPLRITAKRKEGTDALVRGKPGPA